MKSQVPDSSQYAKGYGLYIKVFLFTVYIRIFITASNEKLPFPFNDK